jgi:hypothetical protein
MFSDEFWITLKYPSSWWGIHHVLTLYHRVARVLAYVPVVWDNEDFDHGYILRMLRYKIKRTRDHIAHHQIHTEWERDVKNMDAVIVLLDRIEADDYCKEEWGLYYDKWNPKRELKFEPTPDGNSRMKSMTEQERLEFRAVADKDYAAMEQDWHELWHMLDLHLRSWWD